MSENKLDKERNARRSAAMLANPSTKRAKAKRREIDDRLRQRVLGSRLADAGRFTPAEMSAHLTLRTWQLREVMDGLIDDGYLEPLDRLGKPVRGRENSYIELRVRGNANYWLKRRWSR